jgi:hypothetical protein
LTQNFWGAHTRAKEVFPMNIFKSFFAGLVIAIAAPVLAATINFDQLDGSGSQAVPN